MLLQYTLDVPLHGRGDDYSLKKPLFYRVFFGNCCVRRGPQRGTSQGDDSVAIEANSRMNLRQVTGSDWLIGHATEAVRKVAIAWSVDAGDR